MTGFIQYANFEEWEATLAARFPVEFFDHVDTHRYEWRSGSGHLLAWEAMKKPLTHSDLLWIASEYAADGWGGVHVIYTPPGQATDPDSVFL